MKIAKILKCCQLTNVSLVKYYLVWARVAVMPLSTSKQKGVRSIAVGPPFGE